VDGGPVRDRAGVVVESEHFGMSGNAAFMSSPAAGVVPGWFSNMQFR